jgi:hypothetical protein
MTGISPAQAACEAFWAAVGAGPDGQPPDAAWQWAQTMNTQDAWDAAALAVLAQAFPGLKHQRDEARAVVREMCSVLAEYGEGGQDNDQVVQWRQRAGLEPSP